MFELFVLPFIEFDFMLKALKVCLMLSISASPLGVFLMLRRLSLVGDSLSHGILPGIAVCSVFFGIHSYALFIGGIVAGSIVALISYNISKNKVIPEDASFSVIYITSLALGILILFKFNPSINIMNLLFGNLLAIEDITTTITAIVCIITVTFVVMFYKVFLLYCFDETFFKTKKYNGNYLVYGFLLLSVINLVISYQTIGTLLALGIMIIPAVCARLLSNYYKIIFPTAIFIAAIASYFGLLLSFHYDLPLGPSIVLSLSIVCFMAFLSKVVRKSLSFLSANSMNSITPILVFLKYFTFFFKIA